MVSNVCPGQKAQHHRAGSHGNGQHEGRPDGVLAHDPANGIIEEADETKYLAVGFDQSGRLLEIRYNHINDETVKVFRAMKRRRQFREQLGIER